MMNVILLALLPILAPAQTAGPVDTVDAFHAAIEAGDRDAALEHLAEEVVIFEGGGAEMSRAEYAAHHLDGDMQFSAAMQREVTERRHEVVGDLAYVMNRTRTTGSFRDREIDSSGVETMVLRKGEGGWKIVHIHWSSRSR